jgi:hypothetical protein
MYSSICGICLGKRRLTGVCLCKCMRNTECSCYVSTNAGKQTDYSLQASPPAMREAWKLECWHSQFGGPADSWFNSSNKFSCMSKYFLRNGFCQQHSTYIYIAEWTCELLNGLDCRDSSPAVIRTCACIYYVGGWTFRTPWNFTPINSAEWSLPYILITLLIADCHSYPRIKVYVCAVVLR